MNYFKYMPIIFALITFAGWGVGDIFVTLASRKLGAKQTYFWGMAFAFLLSSLYLPFAGKMSDWGMFFVATVLNIVHIFGNLCYFRGLEVGNAAIVGTLSGSFALVTILISVLFFGESLTALQILAVILTLTGGVLVSLNLGKSAKLSGILSDKGIIYALGSVFGWGIYFALVRIPAGKIGWFWAGFPLYLLNFLLPLFMKDFRKNASLIFSKKNVWQTVLTFSVLITLADFSYNIGILKGFTSIVAPIAGAYPVLFVLLTSIFFKEKLTKQQKIGLGLGLLGIVVISFSSIG